MTASLLIKANQELAEENMMLKSILSKITEVVFRGAKTSLTEEEESFLLQQ